VLPEIIETGVEKLIAVDCRIESLIAEFLVEGAASLIDEM